MSGHVWMVCGKCGAEVKLRRGAYAVTSARWSEGDHLRALGHRCAQSDAAREAAK